MACFHAFVGLLVFHHVCIVFLIVFTNTNVQLEWTQKAKWNIRIIICVNDTP